MSGTHPPDPARTLPPSDPARLEPELVAPAVGSVWFRFVRAVHADPLGVGDERRRAFIGEAVSGPSRFSDPRADTGHPARFRPFYLGASFGVCFLETLLRDAANGRPGDWPLSLSALRLWTCATLAVAAPISAVDLRGDAAVRARVPSDALRASDQSLGRAWSVAFWAHPSLPDGLLYHSRLNGEECLALYADAARPIPSRLACVERTPLPAMADELADALDRFGVALVE